MAEAGENFWESEAKGNREDARELRESLWQALQEVGWCLDMLRTIGERSREEDRLSRAVDWVLHEMEDRLDAAPCDEHPEGQDRDGLGSKTASAVTP